MCSVRVDLSLLDLTVLHPNPDAVSRSRLDIKNLIIKSLEHMSGGKHIEKYINNRIHIFYKLLYVVYI